MPQAGSLTQQTFISHNCGDWEDKSKVPEDSILDEDLLPGCLLPVCAHDLFFVLTWKERERSLSSSCYKDSNRIIGAPTIMTSSKPTYHSEIDQMLLDKFTCPLIYKPRSTLPKLQISWVSLSGTWSQAFRGQK